MGVDKQPHLSQTSLINWLQSWIINLLLSKFENEHFGYHSPDKVWRHRMYGFTTIASSLEPCVTPDSNAGLQIGRQMG